MNKKILFLVIITGFFICFLIFYSDHLAHADDIPPAVKNGLFQVTLVAGGLKLPTAMDFLDKDDILVLEKDNGTVRRIVNGVLLKEPVLDVNVANKFDRGMLGLAIAKGTSINDKNNVSVFIYLTESKIEGSDRCLSWRSCEKEGEPEGNRLYKYKWDGHTLAEPKLLLDLPGVPGPAHNGGVVLIGPDDNIYITIGDLRSPISYAQNMKSGIPADGTSGILRVTQDGKVVKNGILGNSHPLNKYYAYGIRNSYGIDFDPISGNLWDTENGYLFGDEINLIKSGFNSGWAKIQGIWSITDLDEDGKDSISHGKIVLNPKNLIEFNGRGKYSSPELFWNRSVGVTAIRFLDSNNFGPSYQNDILVGDYYGKIYDFNLSKDRTEILLSGNHSDRIINKMADSNTESHTFALGFECVTDIKIGPDGDIYVLSFYDGNLYRISNAYLSKNYR